jgi:hypothetical protein
MLPIFPFDRSVRVTHAIVTRIGATICAADLRQYNESLSFSFMKIQL